MAAVSQHAMRRHPGGALDPSPTYYAFENQQVLAPDKSKRTWNQIFKLSKPDKLLPNTEPLELYGSVLARSMNYAEPWLYGTVRGIPVPSIKHPPMYAQIPEVAVMVCSCPDFLNGTKRDIRKATICKKCRGSRLPFTTLGGTVRLQSTSRATHFLQGNGGTVRLPTINSKHHRPSILNQENDPYDIMRRSRLVSPEIRYTHKELRKNRAKSSSPSRGRSRNRKRSPSPPSAIPYNDNRSRSATRTDGWVNEYDFEFDPARRSILQSDVNAYELISKTSHINEFLPIVHDDGDTLYKNHCRKKDNFLRCRPNTFTGSNAKLSNKSNFVTYVNGVNDEDQSINQPDRPPRKKIDLENIDSSETSPNSEFILTAASLSNISSNMASNIQVNVIKPILKRPTSNDSSAINHYATENINIDQNFPLTPANTKKSTRTNETHKWTYNNKNSSTLSKKNAKINLSNSNDGSSIKNREKGHAVSNFYLPMPQRKKVQFLMENKMIERNCDTIGKDSDSKSIQTNVAISTTIRYNSNETETDNSDVSFYTKNSKDNKDKSVDFKVNFYNNQGNNVNGIQCVDNTNIDEDNNIPFRTKVALRRTLSERRLSEQSTVDCKNVTFIDTTALRNKLNRGDSRTIFTESHAQRIRPKEPPPPPPVVAQQTIGKKVPTRPPRQSHRKSLNKIESEGVTVTVNNKKNSLELSGHDQDDHHDSIIAVQRKQIQANIEVFQGSRLFAKSESAKKTIVKVAPLVINKESAAIHRLEIRNDCSDPIESSKKTSIMINGDDCYSTINVNDNTRLYQSSVVVNDSGIIQPTINKSSSNTVSISVTAMPLVRTEDHFCFQTDKSSKSIIPIGDESGHSSLTNESNLTQAGMEKTTIILDLNDSGCQDSKSIEPPHFDTNEKDLMFVLRNPVEAIKRNLIPHVCGKTNIEDLGKLANNSPEKLNANNKITEKWLETESSTFVAKLLEDPTLGHLAEGLDNNLITKLIENSLIRLKESRQTLDGTKKEKDLNKLIDISLQKVKEERIRLENVTKLEQKNHEEHENHSLSSGNSYSSANYESFDFDSNDLSDCYQSCSSEVTVDEDGNLTRTKFYQMLVDATLSEIEITTNNDDHHYYESIRLNGDPIYEEINDVPPPLPLCPPPNDIDLEKKNSKSMFEGASKYDILSYLVDAKERVLVPEDSYTYNFSNTADIIIEEQQADKMTERQHNRHSSNIRNRISQLSNASDINDESSLKLCVQRKSSAEIERNDSGVGSETSKTSRSKYQYLPGSIVNKSSPVHLCEDCDGQVETQLIDSGVLFAPLVCRKCGKKRAERKEIVTEIIETEEKYSRDLQIILEEFYNPMLVAGLLTQDQLSAIFLNCEELLENSQSLCDKMRDAFDIAIEQGDDDLLTVNMGKLLLDSAPMLHAFESYCIRQAAASLLLANMEKEKELLRIFLRVSQMENAVLRRMNLNSFLMVPVQRVTKYPLLLARLYKVTPSHLDGKDLLKQAQEKIELHLNHMNQEAKDVPTKLWRRISSSNAGRRSSSEIDMINIKLRKMAIDLLEWHHDEVRFAMEGKLLFTQPTDNNWRKGRTIKLSPVSALLVTNGKPATTYKVEKILGEQLTFPRQTGIREAALLMVREKSSRYTLLREPMFLDRCIVCTESDWEDYFEVHEISSKDTFIFKAEDGTRTKLWYTQLQYHAQGMGAWRKRRNALANIMINGMMIRS